MSGLGDPANGDRPDAEPDRGPSAVDFLRHRGPFKSMAEAEAWLEDYREHRQSDGRDERATGDTDGGIIVADDDGELLEDSGDIDRAIEAHDGSC